VLTKDLPPKDFEMSGDLELSTTRDGTCAVVRVGGEVDLGTAGQLSDHAVAAQQAATSLVLDLGGVTFMDSTGLKVLLAVHRRAQLSGGHLALAAPTRSVLKVLTVTGLDKTFTICDTVDDAVQACAAAAAPEAAAASD
jgi:anti-sigma B factor antagonist